MKLCPQCPERIAAGIRDGSLPEGTTVNRMSDASLMCMQCRIDSRQGMPTEEEIWGPKIGENSFSGVPIYAGGGLAERVRGSFVGRRVRAEDRKQSECDAQQEEAA